MSKKREPEMTQEQIEIARIKMPRGKEVLCVIDVMLGNDRVRARCSDGNERICRIRGKLRKRVWMRPGDMILVEPWPVQSDQRGDVIYRYTTTQTNWLKRKGKVEGISLD